MNLFLKGLLVFFIMMVRNVIVRLAVAPALVQLPVIPVFLDIQNYLVIVLFVMTLVLLVRHHSFAYLATKGII